MLFSPSSSHVTPDREACVCLKCKALCQAVPLASFPSPSLAAQPVSWCGTEHMKSKGK